jgi:hypothetical protein
MSGSHDANDAREPLDVLPDRTRAWWTSVLAGQVDAAHPVHGNNLKTQIDGDTLIVSGTVATEEDRNAIAAETEHLKGHGIRTVRNEVEVMPEVTDEAGLLIQTLIGIFESPELAGFAKDYLEGHAHVKPLLLEVIAPGSAENSRDELRALLPEAFWADADKALEAGQVLLIVSVDETQAFEGRRLLAEETPSLQTLILPPEAASNVVSAQRSLDRVEEPSDDSAEQRQRGGAR